MKNIMMVVIILLVVCFGCSTVGLVDIPVVSSSFTSVSDQEKAWSTAYGFVMLSGYDAEANQQVIHFSPKSNELKQSIDYGVISKKGDKEIIMVVFINKWTNSPFKDMDFTERKLLADKLISAVFAEIQNK